MTPTIFAESFSDRPYWWDHAAPGPGTADSLPAHSDVLVVGSGYAGLNCALDLARGGCAVTVLDAGLIGSGASTRNAGLTSGRAGVSKQIDLAALVGEPHADRILQEADLAYQALQDRVAEEGIDCFLQPVGRFVAAHIPSARQKLDRKMAEYNRDGRARFRSVDKEGQSDYVRSAFYHGGMYNDDAGLIHPSLYHKGLRDACVAAGVRLIANCRVTDITPAGSAQWVQTSLGETRADRVVLASNGYTDAASPWHQRRIVPISSTLIATEEIGVDRVTALLPKHCAVIDAKRVICFARPSPDGKRILFGGRAKFAPVGATESAKILHRQMQEVFPELAEVKLTHAWSGLMGFTFDFLPKIGVHGGIHHTIGCNGGCGIVMMSWLGRKTAEVILSGDNSDSAFAGIPFKTQPFYSGAPWFIPIVGNYYKFRDWLDMRAVR